MIIKIDEELLQRYLKDTFILSRLYIKNLNKIRFILMLPVMILANILYLVFLILYCLFKISAFPQDYETDYNFKYEFLFWMILILKIIFLIPSILLIAIFYYPTMLLGGIITLITYPCELLVQNTLNMNIKTG